jgi:uncharacterized membrane protein
VPSLAVLDEIHRLALIFLVDLLLVGLLVLFLVVVFLRNAERARASRVFPFPFFMAVAQNIRSPRSFP